MTWKVEPTPAQQSPPTAHTAVVNDSHLTAEYEKNSRGVNIRVVARALPGESDDDCLNRLDAAIQLMHVRYVDNAKGSKS